MKNRDIEVEAISRSWIAAAVSNQSSSRYAEHCWAIQFMMELPESDHAKAWEVIKTIYRNTENEYALSLLATGPLESLLYNNADQYLEKIENESNNEAFIVLLRQVRLSAEDTPLYK